jgi:hypothetical protein
MTVKDYEILVLDGRVCVVKDIEYFLEYNFRVQRSWTVSDRWHQDPTMGHEHVRPGQSVKDSM